MNSRRALAVVAAIICLACVRPAMADDATANVSGFSNSPAGGYTPQVPVSSFARPASWLDMSRLHVTTSFSMGTGFGGGTSAMQVTSFAYQFASPLAVSVSLGNTFGAGSPGSSMFLEGFSVQYHPHPSFQINVDYRDIRSPLQYQNSPFGYYGR